jgi:hypothetical protein
MLVHLPSYVASFSGPWPSGSTNVIPAIKWQISPVFDLSVTAGAGLPTGANAIVGLGVQPYLQFPWSLALGSGWAATGMMANFLTPASSVNRYTNQSTFVIERQFGERAFLFAEYVGEFPMAGGASHLFNLGGGYRITLTQQIDFHTSVGLNRNAPAYIFGLGYSLRRDKLFE